MISKSSIIASSAVPLAVASKNSYSFSPVTFHYFVRPIKSYLKPNKFHEEVGKEKLPEQIAISSAFTIVPKFITCLH